MNIFSFFLTCLACCIHTTNAATINLQTDPLYFARQHPEYHNLSAKSQELLAQITSTPMPLNSYATNLLDTHEDLLPTKDLPQDKLSAVFAVALFCLVTDIHSSEQAIAACSRLNLISLQNAFYMIYQMLQLLPAATWDDPSLQTTLHNLHAVQNNAFRVLPFTAAACTTLTLLKHKLPTAQNLTEFLNPTTNSEKQNLIFLESFEQSLELCQRCGIGVDQLCGDNLLNIAETCKELRLTNVKIKNTDPQQHLFLNLGCAPFIYSTRSIYVRAFPSLPITWFTAYTTHLFKQRPDVTTPKILHFPGPKTVSSHAYIRAFLLHYLPLAEANNLYSIAQNDYSCVNSIIPDNTPYSCALKLTVLAQKFKQQAANPAAPVWLNADPSLVQFFGPSITCLDNKSSALWSRFALDFLAEPLTQMPDILNDQSNFLPPTHNLLNAIDHFYALHTSPMVVFAYPGAGGSLISQT